MAEPEQPAISPPTADIATRFLCSTYLLMVFAIWSATKAQAFQKCHLGSLARPVRLRALKFAAFAVPGGLPEWQTHGLERTRVLSRKPAMQNCPNLETFLELNSQAKAVPGRC